MVAYAILANIDQTPTRNEIHYLIENIVKITLLSLFLCLSTNYNGIQYLKEPPGDEGVWKACAEDG